MLVTKMYRKQESFLVMNAFESVIQLTMEQVREIAGTEAELRQALDWGVLVRAYAMNDPDAAEKLARQALQDESAEMLGMVAVNLLDNFFPAIHAKALKTVVAPQGVTSETRVPVKPVQNMTERVFAQPISPAPSVA